MSEPSPNPPVIVWFRQDLRVADHPALAAAADRSAPILPLFILDETTTDNGWPGAASRWWLAGSLAALDEDLRVLGSRLILRRGVTTAVLDRLIDETGAGSVLFTRRYECDHAEQERTVAAHLKKRGIESRRFGGSLLFEPESVATKSGTPFRVFTPFYNACLAMDGMRDPVPSPTCLAAPEVWPDSDSLDDWALRPTAPDWAGGLRDAWRPGSPGATEKLDRFVDGPISSYAKDRDRPDRDGTSSLSPHLHFGEIGPRQIWHRVRGSAGRGGGAFLRELVWREFSYHLLHHWSDLPEAPFNRDFARFPWRDDATALTAWQKGMTGYPVVDAGMRQLWRTGWMHNRVRMIVASFLTKHLLLPWQAGADWFRDTLVDADLANNSASWQWVAGCGADAAPWFRIFNPVLQGRKFDPAGDYVRTWVPEIAPLPDKLVHAPWEGRAAPEDYPAPIVDHKFARQRALDAYATLKR